MRIALQLTPKNPDAAVPLNYQYPLSAAIYHILRQAAPDYAAFLHNKGYPASSGRLLKLFTFSKLRIPRSYLRNGALRSGGKEPWGLQIGSPMLDDFVQHFVLGLFESAQLTIAGPGVRAEFRIDQVEALPTPTFERRCRFKCLSPIAASTMHERRGRLQPYYYRPHDAGLSEALCKNLVQKYQIIHATYPPAGSASRRFADTPSLRFHLEPQDRPKSKLITIKQGTAEETQIKAFETYFTLEGSPELMQVAWECGLGEHNSQGFGMIEVVERRV